MQTGRGEESREHTKIAKHKTGMSQNCKMAKHKPDVTELRPASFLYPLVTACELRLRDCTDAATLSTACWQYEKSSRMRNVDVIVRYFLSRGI